MARTAATIPGGARLADYLTVGYLALNCSLGQVKETLVSCGVQTRLRRDMPREVLVYFVMAMCLYPRVAYEEVFRLVIEGHTAGLAGDARTVRPPGSATPAGGGRGLCGVSRHERGWLTLDVPDEQANAQAFGYAQGGRGEAAYPQIRFVALAECATHALCEVQTGGVREDSEQVLTCQLFAAFSSEMLVLADRLFYGYDMWRDAVATGAQLLWRVKSNLRLPCEVRWQTVRTSAPFMPATPSGDTSATACRCGLLSIAWKACLTLSRSIA
ncbi:hypothetical protein OKW28_004843 [Paraburkholderia sp. 40]